MDDPSNLWVYICPLGNICQHVFRLLGSGVPIGFAQHARMLQNRIREVRKRNKLTLEELAEKSGISISHLSRLEAGKRQLYVTVARRIASALEIETAALLPEGARPVGFSEDAEPYELGASDPIRGLLLDEHDFPYRVKTNVLSEVGLAIGDIAIFNIGRDRVRAIKPLEVAICQVYDDEEMLKAVTIIRQFVPPDMLITNSDRENAEPLHRVHDDVQIKGVMVSSYRNFRRMT